MTGKIRFITTGMAACFAACLLLHGAAGSAEPAQDSARSPARTQVRSAAQPVGQAAQTQRITRRQSSPPADGGVAGPCPGAGDCCVANGTPGCDDATCCAAICALDPSCCDTAWDQLCADAAAGDPVNCPQCQPPAPANDNCQDAVIDTLTCGGTLVWTGDNTNATVDCASLTIPEVWHAFTISETMDVTIAFCGTTPVFNDGYLLMDQSCPCSGVFVWGSDLDNTSCGDGNWTLYWTGLTAGTYYYPVKTEPGAMGPYTITVTSSNCTDQCEIAKLLASDGAADDEFGESVSISGNVAVIGASQELSNGTGSAYVYRWNGSAWIEEAKLTASDGVLGDEFGFSVSISGDVVVVGAGIGVADSGSAYVFVKPPGGWADMTETAKLTASDGVFGDEFGFSVSISGDVIVVGAPRNEVHWVEDGAAYVFVEPPGGWADMTETAKLTAANFDSSPGDNLGSSVSISGDVVVAGAWFGDGMVADSGSAYVFVKPPPPDGWMQASHRKLTASDGVSADEFGSSVSISGDVVVVGAPRHYETGPVSGSAYVFVKPPGGWGTGGTLTEISKLTASDVAASDEFGISVSISGDVVVVGAYGDDDNGPMSGSAYVFVKPPGGWVDVTETAKHTASDGAGGDFFGSSVSISGDLAVVGAAGDDDSGNRSGSAYVYGVPGLDCNGNGQSDACDVFTGLSTDFNANLIPDECEGVVFNITQWTFHNTIAEAIAAAANTDQLFAPAEFFILEPGIDLANKSISLSSFAEISQPGGGLYVLADSSTLATAVGSNMILAGELQVGVTDQADLFADQIMISATGLLTAQPGAGVDIVAPNGLINDGAISSFGAVFGVSPVLSNSVSATITAYGDIVTNLTNEGEATYIADTQFLGDYLNNGTTTIQNGTLTIIGTLTNNGTIIGDVGGGAAGGLPVAAGDGLAVIGNYATGAGASLLMPSPDLTVKIAGNFDVAINDNSNYDMAQAELRMIGLGAPAQSLEVMSLDIGPDPAGLDRTLPGHYPIGTWRIGPTATIVNMADVHDNDGLGQKLSEAIYVENLIIEAGATLNTLGRPVYYVNLTNNGTVDDPANLIVLPPPCAADLNGDGDVNSADLTLLLGAWAAGTAAGDIDGDGDTDSADLTLLLGAWAAGGCP